MSSQPDRIRLSSPRPKMIFTSHKIDAHPPGQRRRIAEPEVAERMGQRAAQILKQA